MTKQIAKTTAIAQVDKPILTDTKAIKTITAVTDTSKVKNKVTKYFYTKRADRALRFSPYAWAKLRYLRDINKTVEICGFGITPPDDLLYVEDFVLVEQMTSSAFVSLDEGPIAAYFDAQIALGRQPREFMRVWIHTHPNMSPNPSSQDYTTLYEVFGKCDWMVMCILSTDDTSTVTLSINVGPKIDVRIPLIVDYSKAFKGSDFKNWTTEYNVCVVDNADLTTLSHNAFSSFDCEISPWLYSTTKTRSYKTLTNEQLYMLLEFLVNTNYKIIDGLDVLGLYIDDYSVPEIKESLYNAGIKLCDACDVWMRIISENSYSLCDSCLREQQFYNDLPEDM